MSLDATRVALHQPPQNIMQQLLAAIAQSKQVQARTAQQRERALQAQTPPTVAQQLQAAAGPQAPLPPEMGGIAATAPEGSVFAMAAGGLVKRNFESGGLSDQIPTDGYNAPTYDGHQPDSELERNIRNTLAAMPGAGATRVAGLGPQAAASAAALLASDKTAKGDDGEPSGLAKLWARLTGGKTSTRVSDSTGFEAYMDDRTRRDPKAYPANAGSTAATTKRVIDPNAPKHTKSGLGEAKAATETMSVAANAPQAPATSPYADRAKELQQRLDPLYAAQGAHIKGQRDNENTRYAGLQKARELSTADKLIELGDQFTRAAQASAGTPGGGNGLRGLAAYGSIALKDRKAREADENKEAFAHLEKIGVIDAHSTDKQIAQAMEAYKTFNTAYGADDKTELNTAKLANSAKTAEAAELRAEAAKVTADAKIKKGTGGGGVGGPKPLTEAQKLSARLRIEALLDKDPTLIGDDAARAAKRAQMYAALEVPQVQSGNPAAAPVAGASPGWGQIKRQ